MRNILNICFFYFAFSILNICSSQNLSSEILWAVATEVDELEEKENKKQAETQIIPKLKLSLKGSGGDNVKQDQIIAKITKASFVTTFYTANVLTQNNNSQSLKQYHHALINSLYIPKLYILFNCPKAFLS